MTDRREWIDHVLADPPEEVEFVDPRPLEARIERLRRAVILADRRSEACDMLRTVCTVQEARAKKEGATIERLEQENSEQQREIVRLEVFIGRLFSFIRKRTGLHHDEVHEILASALEPGDLG